MASKSRLFILSATMQTVMAEAYAGLLSYSIFMNIMLIKDVSFAALHKPSVLRRKVLDRI